MRKQFIAALTAIALCLPLITVFAGNTGESSSTLSVLSLSGPELTVVGKRIKGSDQYFEISLEVNGDHREYSSVGAVLEYDASKILPASSWEDGAEAADMSESTDWATRRALPTLGLPSWSTHTALTYIDPVTKKGYLYLGAEYPSESPNYIQDPQSTDAPVQQELPPATPQPTADPSDPHNQPVVAVRFVYAGADLTATKAVKDKIVSDWETNKWDTNWKNNTVLTVAQDEIALKSPAQYSFAIYNADFTRKAYQFAPLSTMSPLGNDELAADSDIEIVSCEGKSAKSGGLSLSDIYVVMFYDWDDSLLGTFTCGVGADSSSDIDAYIKQQFIHPDLKNNANLTSRDRADNYRGEYPYTGPNASNPTLPGGANTYPDSVDDNIVPGDIKMAGSAYPLTNKLDYCFAGKSFNTDESGNALPFTGGWTAVTADTMEDTWTALDDSTNFAKTVDSDEDGIADTDADGNLIDADGNKIDMVSFDLAKVKETDLENGTLSVKAVYIPGEWLNEDDDIYYSAVGPANFETLDSSEGIYGISFEYRRIGQAGYGVTKLREPTVRMELQQTGASGNAVLSVHVDDGEVLDVLLTPTKEVDRTSYYLVDTYGDNIASAGQYSEKDGLGVFQRSSDDYQGYEDKMLMAELVQKMVDSESTVSAQVLAGYGFRAAQNTSDTSANGGFAARTIATTRKYVTACINHEKSRTGDDYPVVSFYQIQWAIAQKITAADSVPDAAEAKKLLYEDKETSGGSYYKWVTFEAGYNP